MAKVIYVKGTVKREVDESQTGTIKLLLAGGFTLQQPVADAPPVAKTSTGRKRK